MKPKVEAPSMPLTDVAIRKAQITNKPYKLSDEKGLFLLINPNGSKYWRLKYRFGGKEKKLSFGIYPEVSLADAREKRDQARKHLSNGVDPGMMKQLSKQSARLAAENSFEAIAREWHAKQSCKWSPVHSEKIIRRLERELFPWLGDRPIAEISVPELLLTLRRIENRGAIDTTHRSHQNCSQIFRYAIATGRAERDLASDLRGAFTPLKEQHHASITDPKKVGELMRAIESYQGSFLTKCALKLSALLFVRPGELRHAEWTEFDFEKAEWRIPANKMKMREIHIVPLSTQTISILNELYPLTGNGKYVFPCVRTLSRPMSENTVNVSLRRLGYSKEEMTAHGFRSMASTILNEQGWHHDAIERQLAHAERDNVRAAYNYAQYLPERHKMMQHWADYLFSLTAHKSKFN